MDTTQLLKLISQDARMEVTDLAKALNETNDTVLDTLNELEKEKIICGYHTLINWDKTNTDHVMALISVKVSPEREFGYDRIAKTIYRYPEVDTMYLLSGDKEFVVIIHGRTMQEIAHFVGSKLACIPAVTGTNTAFVLKEYKVNGAIFDDEKQEQERLLVTP